MAKRKPIEYTCRVMAEWETKNRAVLAQPFGFVGPAIKGPGDINMLCGGCGRLLAEAVEAQTLTDIVLRCCSCRAYNDTNVV